MLESLRARGAERVYLFGSRVSGEADELSNIDIVVIRETGQPVTTVQTTRHPAELFPK